MEKISRREFVKKSASITAATMITGLVASPLTSSAKAKRSSGKNLTFGVITDIHQDIMHDAGERLQNFLDQAKSNKVDFIIELGDFCQTKDENVPFMNTWNSFEGDRYHVIGNHDLDNIDKDGYIKFADMSGRYYSFDKGDFHIVVLDPNNILVDGKFKSPYRSGRYGDHIDSEQIEWLKRDIRSTDKQIIVFSHQTIELEGVVKNSHEIRAIFEDENERVGYTKIIAAFSGHHHTDYQKIIRGIAYIQINSASNQWVGSDYACEERYSSEINKSRPSIKYTIPYKESLYAFVSMNRSELTMRGKKSSFIAPTPEDLKIPRNISEVPLVPYISDFRYTYPDNIY